MSLLIVSSMKLLSLSTNSSYRRSWRFWLEWSFIQMIASEPLQGPGEFFTAEHQTQQGLKTSFINLVLKSFYFDQRLCYYETCHPPPRHKFALTSTAPQWKNNTMFSVGLFRPEFPNKHLKNVSHSQWCSLSEFGGRWWWGGGGTWRSMFCNVPNTPSLISVEKK